VGRHIGLETVFVGFIEDLVLISVGRDEAIAPFIFHRLLGCRFLGVLIRFRSNSVCYSLIPVLTIFCVKSL